MDQYRSLIAYNVWANRRVMAQLQTLPQDAFEKELGGSFPSLKLTIRHLLESDWIWLRRWEGEPIAVLPDWNTETAASIEARWTPVQEAIQAFFEQRLLHELEELVHFKTKKGDSFSLPLWQTIHHTVNHGTYHRGQITNMVRMLGQTPVKTDLFIFYNEMNQANEIYFTKA